MITVLAIVVRGQTRLPYLHAFCVVVLSESLARLIVFATGWTASFSPFLLLDYLVLGVSAVIGT